MKNPSVAKTDWHKWLGIEPSEEHKIYAYAKQLGVPILKGDSANDVYNRIQSLKNFRDTRRMMLITLASTFVAVISAAAAVLALFR